jgi:hypothetical protein
VKDEDVWVSACRNLSFAGEKGRGRKTWKECVTADMRQIDLRREDKKMHKIGFFRKIAFWGTVEPVQARNTDVKTMMMLSRVSIFGFISEVNALLDFFLDGCV